MHLSGSSVTIVGAGLTGPLLALMLARRGLRVTLYERRPDPRLGEAEAGRSINLALAARGMRPLERCGVLAQVAPLLVPMRGRLLHEPSGATQLQPYGQRAAEVIHSVGRAALNRVLVEAAERAGTELRFGQRCVGVDGAAGRLQLIDERSGRRLEASCDVIIGADGAGSPIRGSLAAAGVLDVRVDQLDHDYKEMTIPAVAGAPALRTDALHIWPRGGFMLIALPNCDGSFTVTLFLGRTGRQSFAALADEAAVRRFFLEQFPDLKPHLPALVADFRRNPQGLLATVHASSWHLDGKVLLIGDAAHAIVPFHGQGMNAAFEDCAVFDELLDRLASAVRGVRAAAASEYGRHCTDGARELRGDARYGPGSAVPGYEGARVRVGAALPGPIHSALLDGDVPSGDSLRGGPAPRAGAVFDPERAQ